MIERTDGMRMEKICSLIELTIANQRLLFCELDKKSEVAPRFVDAKVQRMFSWIFVRSGRTEGDKEEPGISVVRVSKIASREKWSGRNDDGVPSYEA